MTFEEKNTWIFAVATLISYGAYVVVLLLRSQGAPLTEVAWVSPMLWAIGASIVVSILGCIAVAIARPDEADKKDQRDKEIHRYGEYVGNSLFMLGGTAALILAMVEADHFWIGNAIYLGGALSGILGSGVKIVSYRRGFLP